MQAEARQEVAHRDERDGLLHRQPRVALLDAVALAVALAVIEGDGLGLLHPLEDRQLASAVDLGAREKLALELEAVAGAHVLQSVDELIVALIRLVTELIAGDSEDGDLVAELVDQCVHGCRGGETGHNESVSTPRRGAREESVRYVLWLLCCALRPEQRTSEVTGRGASERRHVLDENDLALVVTETLLAAACTPSQPPVSNPISVKGMRSMAAGGGLAPTSGSLKSWAEALCIDDISRNEPPRRVETAKRECLASRMG